MNGKLSIGDVAFGVAAGFLLGDFGASLGFGVTWITVVVAVIALAALVVIFRNRSAILKYLAIFLVAAIVGTFYFHFFTDWKAASINLPFRRELSFQAIISDEPEPSDKFLLITAYVQSPFSGTVTIFADPGAVFQYGDLVQVRGIIDAAKEQGDDPVVFPQEVSLIAAGRGFWLRERMIEFKEAIFQKFNDLLPSDEAGLLGGMTLGGTAGMSDVLKNEMSLSGTSYLAAAYGYKMSILVFGSVGLFAGILARRLRFFLALALLGLFVMMTGAEASAVRAAVMGVIAVCAREFGRVPDMRNAIALTAFGMALADPSAVTQAAFLLSFLSLIGIICLGPPFARFFKFDDGDDPDHDHGFLRWKEAVVISVASLLPIIPVLMASFGQFSLMAFVSNVLVFPLILPMMLAGCALAAVGFLSLPFAFFLAKLTEILIWYDLGVIRLSSMIVVPLPNFFTTAWPFILYYAALAFFAYHYASKAAP